MERVLPVAAQEGIQKLIEYAYSFEKYFAPTVVLGEFVANIAYVVDLYFITLQRIIILDTID